MELINMKFNVTIKGICPMLQHRFAEEKLINIRKKSGDKQLDDKEKREIAKQFLYLHNGKVCQPSSHIEGAMIKAGSSVGLSGSGKKTYKDLIKASCFVFPEYIVHKNQKWEVDGRSIVNQTTGGRAMSYRPKLEDWQLSFTLEVNDDRADKDAIKEVLTIAGLRNGIGAYRPRFGRFEILSFKETK